MKVKSGSTLLETLTYMPGDQGSATNICSGVTTTSYYSINGQVVEDDAPCGGCCGGATTATYVWGSDFVDDLIERDSTNLGAARLYVQTDANWDVTSLVSSGSTPAVQERFEYDPYGTRTVLNASWGSAGDSQTWIYGFQGGRLDTMSGLVHFQARDLSTTMGRWMQEDPAGYGDGANLYTSVGGNPLAYTDPTGLEFIDSGNSGDKILFWMASRAPASGYGGHGDQGTGSIQRNIPPDIVTGTSPSGCAYAYVRSGTGLVTVVRSYSGIRPGDQGTGGTGGYYPGMRVYVTGALAAALDRHEHGHILASKRIYDRTIKPAEDAAKFYRSNWMIGRHGETPQQLGDRLAAIINWDARLDAFRRIDAAVNGDGPGSMHDWEARHGGGAQGSVGPGSDAQGTHYDLVLAYMGEQNPGYTEPDFSNFDPWALSPGY